MIEMEKRILAECLRYMILAAQRQGARMLEELLKPQGLTGSHYEVIRVLAKSEPLTLKELGAQLVCESGSPSRLITHMVSHGLVERCRSKGDGRAVELALTPKAKELAVHLEELEVGFCDQLASLLSDEDLQQLTTLFGKLLSPMPVAEPLRRRGLL
ncbi:MarR family winged helix-turn-helix transcriptional regulator [Cohnella lubricantis]|uniref:MarR family transcriptional regulator n=1 Tax=Cohnella lubricantis TaxID=2163172 RepID=A0A841T8E7_9BACL|nr:MarR family transcriptional regulator [Cohnella lubricantis]MBB6676359.1 MarR family transcriptional regulator [Cohnella lubricantis]MBP2118780.1 DNA-binding MarR family transcriptional regulator [Cohnella lubricantis]